MVSKADWARVSKKIYWDRDVPLAQWRSQVAQGHRAYLPDAVATLTPVEFMCFYGLEDFKNDWPTMKAKLPPASLAHTGMYDVAWSQAVGGGWNLKPTPEFIALPTKRRAFMTQVACMPGQSIYQIAKGLGLQYHRAHDHAVGLAQAGQIKCVDVVENGRKQRRLFPTCGAASASAAPA